MCTTRLEEESTPKELFAPILSVLEALGDAAQDALVYVDSWFSWAMEVDLGAGDRCAKRCGFPDVGVLCCVVLCCVVLCCAVLCCAVLCCAVLCCGQPFVVAPLFCLLCIARYHRVWVPSLPGPHNLKWCFWKKWYVPLADSLACSFQLEQALGTRLGVVESWRCPKGRSVRGADVRLCSVRESRLARL